MKHRITLLVAATAVIAMITSASPATARHATTPAYPYVLIDPGTLGGPGNPYITPSLPTTDKGTLVGTSDTNMLDADYTNGNPLGPADPYITHAFKWSKGRMTDLGALPGDNSAGCYNLSARGDAACASEIETMDPAFGYPELRATVFRKGKMRNLQTLSGGTESFSVLINDKGVDVGVSNNGTADPYSLLGDSVYGYGWATQTRAFVWRHGKVRDIGTLGGPDADGWSVNQRSQVAGESYTSSTPAPTTGLPPLDPFVWSKGHMKDLGNLGGAFTVVNSNNRGGLNDKGQVIGVGDVAGDGAAHPFLWDGSKMIDLGTLGGSGSSYPEQANGINRQGDVAGVSSLAGDTSHHAYLYTKSTGMTDLGAGASLCSYATSLNNRDTVVGNASDCHGHGVTASMWKGGSIYDLNTLVAPSDLHLFTALDINSRGIIICRGTLSNGMTRDSLMLLPAKLARKWGLTSNVKSASASTGAPAIQPSASLCAPLSALPAHMPAARRSIPALSARYAGSC